MSNLRSGYHERSCHGAGSIIKYVDSSVTWPRSNIRWLQNIIPFYGLCWLPGSGNDNLPSMVYPYCPAGTCTDYLLKNPTADKLDIVSTRFRSGDSSLTSSQDLPSGRWSGLPPLTTRGNSPRRHQSSKPTTTHSDLYLK